MKYTQEMADKLTKDYQEGKSAAELALELDVPERSVIAKLSSLGVYKAKVYVNKRGTAPIKKEEHIIRIAALLSLDVTLLDSMEKVTKTVLTMLEEAIIKKHNVDISELAYWKDEAALLESIVAKYETEK